MFWRLLRVGGTNKCQLWWKGCAAEPMWLLAHTQRTRRTDEIPFHLMAPKVCRVTKGAVTAKTSTLKTACLFKNHSSVPCPPPEQTVLASTAHSCCTPPSPAATTTSASQQQGRGCGHECRIMGNSQHILSVLNWMACSLQVAKTRCKGRNLNPQRLQGAPPRLEVSSSWAG